MIRNMRIDDVETVYAIDQERLKTNWSEVLYKQELLDFNSRAFVYETDEAVVGFILVKYIGETSDLLQIAVLEAYQNRGIANELFERVWSGLQAEGTQEMILEVNAKNAKAIAFYEQHKFKKIYERKNYYGMRKNAWVMRLRVDEEC